MRNIIFVMTVGVLVCSTGCWPYAESMEPPQIPSVYMMWRAHEIYDPGLGQSKEAIIEAWGQPRYCSASGQHELAKREVCIWGRGPGSPGSFHENVAFDKRKVDVTFFFNTTTGLAYAWGVAWLDDAGMISGVLSSRDSLPERPKPKGIY
jgi:hypothetical protein